MKILLSSIVMMLTFAACATCQNAVPITHNECKGASAAIVQDHCEAAWVCMDVAHKYGNSNEECMRIWSKVVPSQQAPAKAPEPVKKK